MVTYLPLIADLVLLPELLLPPDLPPDLPPPDLPFAIFNTPSRPTSRCGRRVAVTDEINFTR